MDRRAAKRTAAQWLDDNRWAVGWSTFAGGVGLIVIAARCAGYWQAVLINLGTALLLFLPLLFIQNLLARQVDQVQDELAENLGDAATREVTPTTAPSPTRGDDRDLWETEFRSNLGRVALAWPGMEVIGRYPDSGGAADGAVDFGGERLHLQLKYARLGSRLSSAELVRHANMASHVGLPTLMVVNVPLTGQATEVRDVDLVGHEPRMWVTTWRWQRDNGALRAVLEERFGKPSARSTSSNS